MLFQPKFIFAFVVLVLCLVSFNEVYGKPTADTEPDVEAINSPVDRIKRQSCSNPRRGCDRGSCYTSCSEGNGGALNGWRYNEIIYTGQQCTNDYQC